MPGFANFHVHLAKILILLLKSFVPPQTTFALLETILRSLKLVPLSLEALDSSSMVLDNNFVVG